MAGDLKAVGCVMVVGLLVALVVAGYLGWQAWQRNPPSIELPVPPPSPSPAEPKVEASSKAVPQPTAQPEPEPVPKPSQLRPELGTLTVNGRLPREVVQRIVRQNFGRLRRCNDQQREDRRVAPGTITFRFVIGTDGSVGTVSVGDTQTPAELRSCFLHVFRELAFPQPESGIVVVTAPVSWGPTEALWVLRSLHLEVHALSPKSGAEPRDIEYLLSAAPCTIGRWVPGAKEQGTLRVELAVDAQGRVSKLELSEAADTPQHVQSCLLELRGKSARLGSVRAPFDVTASVDWSY
jgi:hypothetical protein